MMYLNGPRESVDLKDVFMMTDKRGHSFAASLLDSRRARSV